MEGIGGWGAREREFVWRPSGGGELVAGAPAELILGGEGFEGERVVVRCSKEAGGSLL